MPPILIVIGMLQIIILILMQIHILIQILRISYMLIMLSRLIIHISSADIDNITKILAPFILGMNTNMNGHVNNNDTKIDMSMNINMHSGASIHTLSDSHIPTDFGANTIRKMLLPMFILILRPVLFPLPHYLSSV